ncbi:MAG TPA: hypothetical protein DDY32_18105, partial [Desulfobulbaceae bacterium]|nr:hypothetical protein [Desulfobulbaceae bacterium]
AELPPVEKVDVAPVEKEEGASQSVPGKSGRKRPPRNRKGPRKKEAKTPADLGGEGTTPPAVASADDQTVAAASRAGL